MSAYEEYMIISRNIASLEDKLTHTPKEDILEYGNIEWMLYQEKERLSKFTHVPSPPKSLIVTWRGTPVKNQDSIQAKFAVNVLEPIIKILNGIKRTINNGSPATVELVNIARGSFGFEFMASSEQQPELTATDDDNYTMANSSVDQSFEQFQEVLSITKEGSDEEFENVISSLPVGVVGDFEKLLKTNEENGAFFSSIFAGRKVAFKDIEDIIKARNRFSVDIKQEEVTLEGRIKGAVLFTKILDLQTDTDNLKIKLSTAFTDEQIGILSKGYDSLITIKVQSTKLRDRKAKYLVANYSDILLQKI